MITTADKIKIINNLTVLTVWVQRDKNKASKKQSKSFWVKLMVVIKTVFVILVDNSGK